MLDGAQGEARGATELQSCRDVVSSQLTVLVVDDDMAVRSFLGDALGVVGYRVVTAATAQEAEVVRRRLGPQCIGLVIMDVNLSNDPEAQDGYVLYRHWTFLHPTLPFLLISGNPRSQALPAIRTGEVPFLAKPFTLSELLEMVRAFFAK